MFDEDDRPKLKQSLQPRNLEGVSREELHVYLAWLATETERTHAALEAKGSIQAAAAALFKS